MGSFEVKKEQSDRLNSLMIELNLTLIRFADVLGMYESNIKSFINGARRIPENVAENMSKTLGVSKEWLLTGKGEKFEDVNKFESLKNKSVVKAEILTPSVVGEYFDEKQVSRLKCLLNESGMPLDEFVLKSGIPRKRMNDYLIGRRSITITDAYIIERAFGVSKTWLLYGKGTMYSEVSMNYKELKDCINDIQQNLLILRRSLANDDEAEICLLIRGENAKWLNNKAKEKEVTPEEIVDIMIAQYRPDKDSLVYPVVIGDRNSLSKYIAQARSRYCMSMTDLANLSNLNVPIIHRIEEGDADYYIDSAMSCLHALKSSIVFIKDGCETVQLNSNIDFVIWLARLVGESPDIKDLANSMGRSVASIRHLLRHNSSVSVDAFIGAAGYYGYQICIVKNNQLSDFG